MKQETADELDCLQGHRFGLVSGGVVLPFESDPAICERYQPPVGDGHAVRVASEILENLLRSSKGSLGVDYLLDMTGLLAQPASKASGWAHCFSSPWNWT
jgi:hypothetical protein